MPSRGPAAGRSSDGPAAELPSSGPAAETARAEFRAAMDAKGHAVDNARTAAAGLEGAFASGALVRTPALERMLDDLALALEQDDGQKLGGKSAEAARFITRRLAQLIDEA